MVSPIVGSDVIQRCVALESRHRLTGNVELEHKVHLEELGRPPRFTRRQQVHVAVPLRRRPRAAVFGGEEVEHHRVALPEMYGKFGRPR